MLYYASRPPKTARVSRKIWDALTDLLGHEPVEVWLNGNGWVWGYRLGNAWYSVWFYKSFPSGEPDDEECVPIEILVKAGARQGKLWQTME